MYGIDLLTPVFLFWVVVMLVVNFCMRKNIKKIWFGILMSVSIAMVFLGVFTPLNTFYFSAIALIEQGLLLIVILCKRFGKRVDLK